MTDFAFQTVEGNFTFPLVPTAPSNSLKIRERPFIIHAKIAEDGR